MTDRTVHATYPGLEVVRYDKAGKWYLEPLDKSLRRQAVTLEGAVRAAVYGVKDSTGEVYFGRRGGAAFDRKVKAALA